jgi:hypothetical protein
LPQPIRLERNWREPGGPVVKDGFLVPSQAVAVMFMDHWLCRDAVQFYHGEEFLLSTTSDLTLSALGAGDGIVVVLTARHQLALEQRLRKLGIDFDELLREQRMIAIDACATLSSITVNGGHDFSPFMEIVGGAINRAAEATGRQQAQIMVLGELTALSWAEHGLAGMMDVAQFWRVLARLLSFSYLSCYPIDYFAAPGMEDVFLRICAGHSTVIPPDDYPNTGVERRILRATARAYGEPSWLPAVS